MPRIDATLRYGAGEGYLLNSESISERGLAAGMYVGVKLSFALGESATRECIRRVEIHHEKAARRRENFLKLASDVRCERETADSPSGIGDAIARRMECERRKAILWAISGI